MKLMKKLLCITLMAALLLAVAAPALADVVVPDKVTAYLASTDGSVATTGKINIVGIDPTSVIKSVKSSNKKIVKVNSVMRTDISLEILETGTISAINGATIQYQLLKAGAANVSMKIDGATYKTKVIAKKYANPIKSLVLTGAGSKNLKAKFAKTSWVSEELNAKIQQGTLKLSAASGWKITNVRWVNNNNGLSMERWLQTPKSSITMSIPAMKKSGSYCIKMDFDNTENGATIEVYYWLGTN